MWGHKWNTRRVVGRIYREEVQQEVTKLVEEGQKPLTAYQPALTKVLEGLSDEDRKRCTDQAHTWNSGAWPRDLQTE